MRVPRAAAAAWLTAAGLAAAVVAAALFEVRAARAAAGAEREVRSEFSRELELDETEWDRVRTRRAGLGAPLAALTPYEVLGLYAESPEQRRRYAAANARFMLDFHRRAMEFEELYRTELIRLAAASADPEAPAPKP